MVAGFEAVSLVEATPSISALRESLSASILTFSMRRYFRGDLTRPKGERASKARLRKVALVRELKLPEDGLPKLLSLTYRCCGKATCHCVDGQGHPQ